MSSGIPPWRASASTTTTTPVYPNYTTPAYIPVQARRSLTSPASNSTTPVSPQPTTATTDSNSRKPKRVEWPAPVRMYVQRSFAPEHQIPGVSREEMETKLKLVITEAAQSDRLDKIDWEKLPLPQIMVQNDKTRILANSEASTWGTPFPTQTPKHIPAGDEVTKKRKSAEYQTDSNGYPPWRQTNKTNAFEDRITYSPTDKRQRIDFKNSSSKSQANLEMRKKRFEEGRGMYGSSPSSRGASPTPAPTGPVVGRCQDLEKNYFRLTSAPNPDTVRPLPVLMKTLDLLKKKWKKDNNYTYICDQFKSLRQDLTVQHIKNEFTVSVYEIHARIALEKGDLGEYNQCQTQLRALYAQQLGGHPTEFKAYRVLYFIHTRNWTAMNDALADLTPADKQNHAVKHALDVRSALALGNYHRFFQLYLDTPNMGAYLMDMFVDRERLSALAAICKAYKPDVKIRFITEELGFESDEQSARFILDHISEEMLQERDGVVRLLTGGKAAQLFELSKTEAHRVVDIKGQI
ncbi:SAC3/GANP domain protein [Aspergillus lucknowensis]|uniref:SAC3/GANP/Nin1/mts3/eIF-3 p25 family-domain-containing protein n=1 Tax=Aspergillus lucknowensis TaxID=176173 RepID=A0ABR4LQQ5_9EURO